MDEQIPLEPGEFLLRRIPKRAVVAPCIDEAAFSPSTDDTDGLSIYRERFVTPQEVANHSRTPCFVVRFPYEIVTAINVKGERLTVQIDPRPPLRGHCIIPEISIDKKPRYRGVRNELVKAVKAIPDSITPASKER